MAKYEVWVSHPDSQDRINIHEGDNNEAVAEQLYALLKNAGDAQFDGGFSINATEKEPPVVPPPGAPPVTAPQTAPSTRASRRG